MEDFSNKQNETFKNLFGAIKKPKHSWQKCPACKGSGTSKGITQASIS